ncbi:uncharacterized protein LOC134258781 [Saccostrea cucullata]|uniref:uncharacterized protein LOC134258781 n=1 Tax=Saccostrea cuccullata TaxID=36930 RepID=UPI002ED685F0
MGSKALRCGNTGVSIKPECVCSFHNVWEAMYHDHSSCPGEVKSDNVRLLRSPFTAVHTNEDELDIITKPVSEEVKVDENFSKRDITSTPQQDEDAGDFLLLGETSPGNMDNLSHRIRVSSALFDVMSGQSEIDHPLCEIRCDCPLRFEGMFCENKMEKVTRICDRNENASSLNYLQNCDRTKMDCITYSENKRYTFKCTKKSATILRGKAELPICRETEINTTELNAAITPEGDIRLTNPQYTSRGKSLTPTLSFILFLREYELL